jgi:hypothetical protein
VVVDAGQRPVLVRSGRCGATRSAALLLLHVSPCLQTGLFDPGCLQAGGSLRSGGLSAFGLRVRPDGWPGERHATC